MKARFGRNIYCQKCGKDDKIKQEWYNTKYICKRCDVEVYEANRKGPAPECFGSFEDVDKCHGCEWKPECFYMPGSWVWRLEVLE